jgi:hypothetical protein
MLERSKPVLGRAPKRGRVERLWKLTRYDAGGFSLEWNSEEREWQISLPPYEGKRALIARGPDVEGVIEHALHALENL